VPAAVTKSWKTSASGGLAIAIGVAIALKAMLDGQPVMTHLGDLLVALGFGSAGAVGLAARDNGVSSESAGAK
jgi:hypothetical protein